MTDIVLPPRLNDALPPRHPSSPAVSTSSSHQSNNTPSRTLQRAATSAPALPFIQTSPEEWLAHAAQQRRHLSTCSFSSTTSSTSTTSSSLFHNHSNNSHTTAVQSPVQLAFGESEQVLSESEESRQRKFRRIPDTTTAANGTDLAIERTEAAVDGKEEGGEEEEQEPVLNVNVRPSELRASLMARARRSSAKLQQQQRTRSESMLVLDNKGSRLSGQSNQSFSSAFDSRLSTRSSTSSSISGWAPRARSSSVSSQGSNDSVNLDALIAGGSDINEECPLDLEDADDVVVDWSKEEQEEQLPLEDPLPVPVQHGQRSRRSTGASATSSLLYDDRHSDEYWDESPEMTEEDSEFDETLKGFSQLSMKNAIPAVRGLAYAGQQRSTATGSSSSRFPDGRNPFDLDADYLNTPSGLTSPTNRLSTLSQDSNISSRSSISSIGGSRLQPPGVSRLPGAPGSGLKAPASRLAQPGSRSGVPQPGSKVGITRPTGLQAPKSGSQAPKTGIQAPKTGIQAPKTGLQAPRTGLQAPRTGSSSSLVKTSTNGRTTSAIGSRLTAPSRVPSKAGSGIAAPSTTTTRSHIVAPGSNIKRAASVSTGNRNSTLSPPSTVASRSASSSTLVGRSNSTIAGSRTTTSPQRTGAITPSQLASPTRVSSGRLSSSSSHMVSPTSSQSSTPSLSSFAHARDTVTPLSQRLSNATGTSQLMRPKTVGTPRSVSMYGSSSLLPPTGGRNHQQQQQHHYQQQEDEVEYAVLTPPQSPSSKRVMSGLPRSGMAMPSRLTAPSVSTSRVPRSMSPAPLSAGSNSGGSSYLPRPHTPTSSLPGSRILSGIVSPRAGRS